MEVKEFLREPEKLDILIRNKLIEKEQYRDIALGITANMQADKVQTSGSQTKMADAINKLVDMETEIDSLIDRFIDKKKAVVAVIEQLDNPTEYNVLHLRYIQLKEYDEIGNAYGKDYNWATTVHGRALKSVQAILDRGPRDMSAKPCPFCGGKPIIQLIDEDNYYYYYSLSHICNGKGDNYDRIFMSCGIKFKTEEDAIEHWNIRKEEAI